MKTKKKHARLAERIKAYEEMTGNKDAFTKPGSLKGRR